MHDGNEKGSDPFVNDEQITLEAKVHKAAKDASTLFKRSSYLIWFIARHVQLLYTRKVLTR